MISYGHQIVTQITTAIAASWAVLEPLFRTLDTEVSKGQELAGARAPTWKDATDTLNKYKAEFMRSTLLGTLGKRAFEIDRTRDYDAATGGMRVAG